MIKRFLTIIAFLCIADFTYAQYKFSSDPAAFPQDVNTVLGTTKNPVVMQVGTNFSGVFSSFTPAQQKRIIEVTQKLSKTKKLRVFPNFSDFFSILTTAKNKGLSVNNIDTFLVITDKASDKYDGKQLQGFLQTIKDFLEQGAVFRSSYNSLKVSGGTISFKWVEAKESGAVDDYEQKVVQEDTSKKAVKEDAFSDWDTPVEQDNGFGTLEDNSANNDQPDTDVLDVGYNYPAQPAIDGAVIEFKDADFTFVSQGDSSILKAASGSLMLKNGVFVGKGGTMDWTGTGVPANEIYCEMREYNFSVRATSFISEGAKLHYPARTDSIVEGIFEYKAVKNKEKFEPQYPRFKSFKSNIAVKGLDANIIYNGGLSLAGKKIYSSSVDEGFASIEIKKDGKTKIRAQSPKFELGDSLIYAPFATLTLYVEEDSITHPGVTFKYNKNKSELRVTKQSGFNYAPFVDTYHQIEIISDAINWDLNKKDIEFNILTAKNQVPATFESEEYYHADKFYKLKGLYRFHPLQVVVAYSEKMKIETFYAGDVAAPLKIDLNTFKGAMVQLMKLGYIDYNTKSGLIKLRPKAKHYVLSSRNKKDYDNITFISLSAGAVNATLDTETHGLLVRGVDRIYISDSLKVNIAPNNKEINIEKNRNFKFNGNINTENFQFIGQRFEFVYDSFLVHMPQIDQIKLAVTNKKKNAKDTASGKSRVLGNELRYSSGTLYINKPDNKSAKKKLAQYPIFDATSGASVYFNKKNINGGAYDTSVKFEIPPFRLDSLSSDDPHSIGFDGTFKSGGIFPEFKEKLVVMPDYSLGFTHKVPKDGYQLYGGTGKYYNTVNLDNKGVRGDGEIRYLTTTLLSKDFNFYKDSVLTEGTSAKTKEGTHPDAKSGVTFPSLKIAQYRLKWLPRPDSMFISNVKLPLEFYDSSATMQGTANVTKNGMLGKGVLFTRGSESESKKFSFEQKKFGAREAGFKIDSDDPDKPALNGINVKLAFDLDSNKARFSPEIEGTASNSFPYVQYKTSLADGVWDLKKKMVYMKMPDGGNINKSFFYSTREDQDSLVYNATNAVYDIPKQVLNINGIPYIKVADAKIFPDSNRVVIEQNAVMTTLQNAKIEIDTVKQYHHLYDGTLDITSRLKFGGVATYQYVNLGSDTLAIRFQDFRLEPGKNKKDGMHTVATGLVKDDDSLFIGPKIIYKGKVMMYAENPYLMFDGYIKLDLKGALSYSEWLKFYNDGATKEVKIDLQNAVSDNGTPLSSGLHLDRRTNQIYTTFISKKVAPSDPDFFIADKAFQYDLDSNEFRVGNHDKFSGKSLAGNNLRYDDTKSIIRYSGKFTFVHMDEKNTNIKLLSSGDGYADLNNTNFNFNTLLSFYINLNSSITAAIAQNLKNATDILPQDTSVYDENSVLNKEIALNNKLAAIVGDNSTRNYKSKKAVTPTPLYSVNSDFAKSFLFSNVDLKWSPVYKAFYSVGKIEVASIQKKDINKSVNGYIEIRKSGKGDIINIYLEPTPNHWYFITYNDNRLATISSDDEVNTVIRGKSKGELPDRSKFYFVAAEPIEKQKFVHEFKEHYLGESETQIEEEEKATEEQLEKTEPQQDDIDINEEVGKEEVPQTEEKKKAPEPEKGKKKKKKDANYDQYKLPGQEDEQTPTETEPEKEKPTIEDQQQLQKDQQKMKDLFK